MELKEYEKRVKQIFIKNCLKDVDESEKEQYLNSDESKEVIENCYRGDRYLQENMNGFEDVFDDYSILSRTCRTLEDLY